MSVRPLGVQDIRDSPVVKRDSPVRALAASECQTERSRVLGGMGRLQCLHSETLSEDPGLAVFATYRAADRVDTMRAPFAGAELDQEDLILVMVDQLLQGADHLETLHVGQVASEHRELEMLTESLHRLEDLAQPLRVRDVVGDDEKLARLFIELMAEPDISIVLANNGFEYVKNNHSYNSWKYLYQKLFTQQK